MPTLSILRDMYASIAFSYVHAKYLTTRGHQHHIRSFNNHVMTSIAVSPQGNILMYAFIYIKPPFILFVGL